MKNAIGADKSVQTLENDERFDQLVVDNHYLQSLLIESGYKLFQGKNRNAGLSTEVLALKDARSEREEFMNILDSGASMF